MTEQPNDSTARVQHSQMTLHHTLQHSQMAARPKDSTAQMTAQPDDSTAQMAAQPIPLYKVGWPDPVNLVATIYECPRQLKTTVFLFAH